MSAQVGAFEWESEIACTSKDNSRNKSESGGLECGRARFALEKGRAWTCAVGQTSRERARFDHLRSPRALSAFTGGTVTHDRQRALRAAA